MAHKSKRFFAVATVISALLLSIFRILITILFTSKQTGIYIPDSIFPQVFDYIVAIITVATVLFPCLNKKCFETHSDGKVTKFTTLTSAILAFMFIFASLSFIFAIITSGESDAVVIALAVSAALSSLYYLSTIFSKNTKPGLRAVLSMIPIIWVLIVLIESYFDMKILITSPNRAYHQTALLAFALFVLSETRRELSFEKNLLFAPSASAATVLLAVSSLPNLLFPHILSAGSTDRPIIYAFEFAAALYCASKLCAYGFQKDSDM